MMKINSWTNIINARVNQEREKELDLRKSAQYNESLMMMSIFVFPSIL